MSLLDRFSLRYRVAVVTGASSGLGVAIASGLADAGAHVVLAARRLDKLREVELLVEERGRRVASVATDVSVPEECRALIDAAMARFGRVDVLVNNAGTGISVAPLRETPEQFRGVLDVNLGGVYWTAQAAAAVMEPGSAIVNTASIGATILFGLPQAAYASSKAAMLGLTRDLANQWTRRRGIRVNAVAPGFIHTELTDWMFEGDEFQRSQADLVPAGRGGAPDEVAAAAVFLVSPAASFVNGTCLVVDGGRTIY